MATTENVGILTYVDSNNNTNLLYPATRTDAINAVSDLPMNGYRVTGIGSPSSEGDAVPLGYANGHFAPALESAEYPGCYYRTVNGVFEWINPPMVLGVEYRTTERWNGKAVYTKKHYFGASANNLVVQHEISMTQLIRDAASCGVNSLPCIWVSEDSTLSVWYVADNASFSIFCGKDRIGEDVTAQFWYTKD